LGPIVLDEQLAGGKLVAALRDRGLDVRTLDKFGVTGKPDPHVVRRVDEAIGATWVFVTMDLTILEDFPNFDWGQYAIAWIRIPEGVSGAAVEHAKHNVVQRHAHLIVEQARGDHHTYTSTAHFKSPPSLTSQLGRKR